jgi:hypothetical protein
MVSSILLIFFWKRKEIKKKIISFTKKVKAVEVLI